MLSNDFSVEGLTGDALKVANIIRNVVAADNPNASGGGCKAFRTVEDHKARGEEYGRDSVLILVHDGGDLAPYCNYDYQCYARVEKLQSVLENHGFHVENCTTWYSAVYKG